MQVQTLSGNEVEALLGLKCNKNALRDLKYLQYADFDKETFIVLTDNDKILGVSGIQKSFYDKDLLWLLYISVDEKHRNKGVASLIVHNIFTYAHDRHLGISISRYSDDGELYLKKVIDKEKNNYPFMQVIIKD